MKTLILGIALTSTIMAFCMCIKIGLQRESIRIEQEKEFNQCVYVEGNSYNWCQQCIYKHEGC